MTEFDRISKSTIDVTALLEAVQSVDAGATILFTGTARRFTESRETLYLEYEAYDGMAERELIKLEEECVHRFGVLRCCSQHRVGRIELGEVSVAVAISGRHRAETFAAGKWFMDELKSRVPIWKREFWADGNCEWQHPQHQPNESAISAHGDGPRESSE